MNKRKFEKCRLEASREEKSQKKHFTVQEVFWKPEKKLLPFLESLERKRKIVADGEQEMSCNFGIAGPFRGVPRVSWPPSRTKKRKTITCHGNTRKTKKHILERSEEKKYHGRANKKHTGRVSNYLKKNRNTNHCKNTENAIFTMIFALPGGELKGEESPRGPLGGVPQWGGLVHQTVARKWAPRWAFGWLF